MAKHVLLTFLSDVKKNGPKQGPWTVSRSRYEGIGDTYTTNESAVRYLMQKGWNNEPIRLERIFAFASNTVLEEEVGANHPDLQFPNISIDEHGLSLTHFAYFRKRIEDIVDVSVCLPETGDEKHYSPSDPICIYDDESPDIKRTMSSVIGMSGKIQRYLLDVAKESVEGEAVILHADMSGGFRHAAMMMMAVMRLIQFAGIQIGHVLYSNWTRLANDPVYSGEGVVQEVGDIYGMYDMVSGATEFTNFGSVKSFSDYFAAREQSKELEKLLASMRNFDEAIKISRRREFTEAVNNLKESLHEFGTYVGQWPEVGEENIATSADVSDLLMNSLRHRIQHDYKELLTDEVDELVYIEWCLQHGYLQQALTLFTESFPDFITRNELVTVTEKGWAGIRATQNVGDPREPVFYMLTDYVPSTIPILWLNENLLKLINDEIKSYIFVLLDIFKLTVKQQRAVDHSEALRINVELQEKQNELKQYKENIHRLLEYSKTQKRLLEDKVAHYIETTDEFQKLDYQKKQITENKERKKKIQVELKKTKIALNYLMKTSGFKELIYEEDKQRIMNCLTVIEKLFSEGFKTALPTLDNTEIDSLQGIVHFSKQDLIEGETLRKIIAVFNASLKGISQDSNPVAKLLNRNKLQWNRLYNRCSKVEMLLYCGEIEMNYIEPTEMLPILDSYYEIKAIRNDTAHAKQDKKGRMKSGDVKSYNVREIKSLIGKAIQSVRSIQEKVKAQTARNEEFNH